MNYPDIILIRHGETEWNREMRFQGRLNSPLTLKGKFQAEENGIKLRKYIKDINRFKIFASPLDRAKNTAYIIVNKLGVNREDIIFDNRIIEFNYGIFEGKKKEEIIDSKEYQEREKNKWNYVIKNGESYEIVYKRVLSFLNSIRSEEKVIIIAHAMVNRIIRGIYCNSLIDEVLNYQQSNSQLFLLQKERCFLYP